MHIVKASKSLSIGDLSFRYLFNYRPVVGFVVSKKYGNAVSRNLFKRRVRMLFIEKFISRGVGVSLIIRPRKQNISFNNLSDAFECLYKKICV